VKDCKHIEKSEDFLSEIQSEKFKMTPSRQNNQKGKIKEFSFILPPRFMELTQGDRLLDEYNKQAPELASEKVKGMDIKEHAYKERNKPNLPITPLRKISSTGEVSKLTNNSVEYFKSKYRNYFNKLLKTETPHVVLERINKFNAHLHISDIRSSNLKPAQMGFIYMAEGQQAMKEKDYKKAEDLFAKAKHNFAQCVGNATEQIAPALEQLLENQKTLKAASEKNSAPEQKSKSTQKRK
jgi:hypothetical protein